MRMSAPAGRGTSRAHGLGPAGLLVPARAYVVALPVWRPRLAAGDAVLVLVTSCSARAVDGLPIDVGPVAVCLHGSYRGGQWFWRPISWAAVEGVLVRQPAALAELDSPAALRAISGGAVLRVLK